MLSRKLFFILFIVLGVATEMKAQFLSDFSALQHNNSIELNIAIAGGNTCNGISILRSTDGIVFAPIGGIAGVCGSSTEDVFYSFTDNNPVPNRNNYYRLDLITLGYTSIIKIHFIFFGENEILFYPNPMMNNSSVYLQTNNADVSSYRVNDRYGKLLKQVDGIRGNYFELTREDWPAGMYFLEVRTGSRKPIIKPFMVF